MDQLIILLVTVVGFTSVVSEVVHFVVDVNPLNTGSNIVELVAILVHNDNVADIVHTRDVCFEVRVVCADGSAWFDGFSSFGILVPRHEIVLVLLGLEFGRRDVDGGKRTNNQFLHLILY